MAGSGLELLFPEKRNGETGTRRFTTSDSWVDILFQADERLR
jgi:hypothetical protein